MGKSKNKAMFGNSKSFIYINDGRMYVMNRNGEGYSPTAITILPGFQIELGRKVSDVLTALKETRLPIAMEISVDTPKLKQYTVIRTATGKVDSRNIATISCKNGIISAISFHREVLKDTKFRSIVRLGVLHQLALPKDAPNGREQQVVEAIKSARMMISSSGIEVIEEKFMISAIVAVGSDKLKYTFLSNSNNNDRYELASVSLC